ncbi:hypothetical protein BGW38_005980 [Lunasporangiospora selenospora]|uniref:Uncharacterized protein n=1 Tax=Lunasporangiospora selenospora TaxID=979761 RepID=A0A9P6FN55_9FUNG|nr:hypothetical protein BGW38_005980 [Lunasporangiospora selenospora]
MEAQDKKKGKEHVLCLTSSGSSVTFEKAAELIPGPFLTNFKNLEESFWADRVLQVSTRFTSKHTAIALQKSSAKQVIHEYQRFEPELDEDGFSEIYEDNQSDTVSEKKDRDDRELDPDALQVGRKHPCNTFDDIDVVQSKTPRYKSPSPAPITTESLDSPPEVRTSGQQRDPFLIYEGDDEDDEDGTIACEENGVLLPDKTDQVYRFSAMLDNINVVIGFQTLFAAVKKETVYIPDVNQALAFMSMPNKRVTLNFIDSTTKSGSSRNGTNSRKEPDLALEIKDRDNLTICEVGVGEITSHAKKGYKKKSAKDLVRIGLALKDALDLIQDKSGIDDSTLVGWQVIGKNVVVYLMFKCDNLYIMVHVRNVIVPDNLTELSTICTQYKIWSDLRVTFEQGLTPVLQAVESDTRQMDGTIHYPQPASSRIATTHTPEFRTLLTKG